MTDEERKSGEPGNQMQNLELSLTLKSITSLLGNATNALPTPSFKLVMVQLSHWVALLWNNDCWNTFGSTSRIAHPSSLRKIRRI